MSLSVAANASILDIASKLFEGKNLNEQLFRTMKEDELLALANLFYRLGNFDEQIKIIDSIIQKKEIADSEMLYSSLRQ